MRLLVILSLLLLRRDPYGSRGSKSDIMTETPNTNLGRDPYGSRGSK